MKTHDRALRDDDMHSIVWFFQRGRTIQIVHVQENIEVVEKVLLNFLARVNSLFSLYIIRKFMRKWDITKSFSIVITHNIFWTSPLSIEYICEFICTLYNSSMFLCGIYLWNTWRSYECIVWLDSNELRTCVCSCCGSLVRQLAAAAGRLLPNVGSDQVAGAAIDHTPCVHSFHILAPLFPRSRNFTTTGSPQVLLGFASGIYSSGQPVKWTVYYISG